MSSGGAPARARGQQDERPRNFALIGSAGFVAPRHIAAIQATGNRLVAVLDPRYGRGKPEMDPAGVMRFGETRDFERFLDEARQDPKGTPVDYVSVCSPSDLHESHIRLALRHHAHVICEKPVVVEPSALCALEEIEAASGRRVHTVLQLRLHPDVIAMKRLRGGAESCDVAVTYVARRGADYHASWKGSAERSGGLAMNIGIHFFDLLMWLFGPVERSEVHLADRARMRGSLELQRARVSWFLSIDESDLPAPVRAAGGSTYRSLTVDGIAIDLTQDGADLHTQVYREVLAGRGVGLAEARPSLELVRRIQNSPVGSAPSDAHPHLAREKGMAAPGYLAHESAYVDDGAVVGDGTRIWHFSHIAANARVGRDCRIGQNVYVASGAVVGDRVKIQNNVSVYEGCVFEDEVFCGPGAVFTNVRTPRSAFPRNAASHFLPTVVRRGATIGANATVVCGATIGELAFVAAGAVVTEDVPPHGLAVGVPARVVGWVCECGPTLDFEELVATCASCGRKYRQVGTQSVERIP